MGVPSSGRNKLIWKTTTDKGRGRWRERRKNQPSKQIRLDLQVKGDEIEVVCYDNGEGISAEYLDKIFDAFFTTKKVGEGVGLGLNICHRIMTQHHGSIKVESDKGDFCRFTLSFPKYNPSVAL